MAGKTMPYDQLNVGYAPFKKKPTWRWFSYSGGSVQDQVYQNPAGLGADLRREKTAHKVNYGTWPEPRLPGVLQKLGSGEDDGGSHRKKSYLYKQMYRKTVPYGVKGRLEGSDSNEKYENLVKGVAEAEKRLQSYKLLAKNFNNDLIKGGATAEYRKGSMSVFIENQKKMEDGVAAAKSKLLEIQEKTRGKDLSLIWLAWVAIAAGGLFALDKLSAFAPALYKSTREKLDEAYTRGLIDQNTYKERVKNLNIATGSGGGMPDWKYMLIGIGAFFILVQSGILKDIISGVSGAVRESIAKPRGRTKTVRVDPRTGQPTSVEGEEVF